MRLSDAIMLGRVTIPRLKACDITKCALGMAANAQGINADYDSILEAWPWVKNAYKVPPLCACYGVDTEREALSRSYTGVITHLFDTHVMERKNCSLEQLVDWVRSVEPGDPQEETKDSTKFAEQPEDITWTKSLAV